MKVQDLKYHKEELHKVSEEIKQLKKDVGITKRKKSEEILDRLLKNYRYWVSRAKTKANINRVGYIKNKIKDFYRFNLSRVFHQSAIVVLMKTKKERKE